MKIRINSFTPGQKIPAIKALRMVTRNFVLHHDGAMVDFLSLKDAKAVFDRVEQGEKPVLAFAFGGEPNVKVALAMFEAHGVQAEEVVPTVEVPVGLLRRLKIATAPGESQTTWDLYDEAAAFLD